MVRVLGALALGCLAYGTLIERRWYATRSELLGGALRDGADRPLRVLLVADLHHSPPDPPLARELRRLGDLEYDLVVAGGDLLGADHAEDTTVQLLAPLTDGGRPGVAILGSNDRYAPGLKSPHVYFTDPDRRITGAPLDTDRFRRGLRATGWTLLEDRRAVIGTAVGPVEVAGLRDPHLGGALPRPEDIAASDEAAVLRLGLVHAPYRRALDLLVGCGYDVVLAGHTHGGQVRLPLVGALTANCDLPLSRVRGTSTWRDDASGRQAWLHVSAGLGQSRYAPFRFLTRPEASLLTLSR